MKKTKFISSILLCGVLVGSMTGCNNTVPLDEAGEKVNGAAIKTQARLKDELAKDMFSFETNFDLDFDVDAQLISEVVVTDQYGEKDEDASRTIKSKVAANMGIDARLFGNFDTKYYLNYTEGTTDTDDTNIFGYVKGSSTIKQDGVSQKEKLGIAANYKAGVLSGVMQEVPTEVIDIPVEGLEPEMIKEVVASIKEVVNADPEEIETPTMGELMTMVGAALELTPEQMEQFAQLDLTNLNGAKIVAMIKEFAGESLPVSMEAYLAAVFDDIMAIDYSKIVEVVLKEKDKYDLYSYELNYDELKDVFNKILKSFEKNADKLSEMEKQTVVAMVGVVKETIKTVLPEELELGFGIGVNSKGMLCAVDLNVLVEGMMIPLINNVEQLTDGTRRTTTNKVKLNEFSLDVTLDYGFANEAYTIPSLVGYFK